MNSGSKEAIRVLIQNDPNMPKEQRLAVFAAIDGKKPKANPKLVTRKRVAEILNCGIRTVDRLIKEGVVREIRFSCRQIRFDEHEIITLAREGVAA